MPQFRKGTRQHAEARLATINKYVVDSPEWDASQDEWSELTQALEAGLPDDTNPVYSKAELEAAGQGGLF
ncbi:MAG: hypothetical protein JNK63_09825 [Chthonomonas sp.]|nr:hypothetical protein [Chthonomonas sp.]